MGGVAHTGVKVDERHYLQKGKGGTPAKGQRPRWSYDPKPCARPLLGHLHARPPPPPPPPPAPPLHDSTVGHPTSPTLAQIPPSKADGGMRSRQACSRQAGGRREAETSQQAGRGGPQCWGLAAMSKQVKIYMEVLQTHPRKAEISDIHLPYKKDASWRAIVVLGAGGLNSHQRTFAEVNTSRVVRVDIFSERQERANMR